MRHADLPRVLRRAVGLMRFAREAVGASEASLFILDAGGKNLRGVVSEWDWTRTSFGAEIHEWPTVARCLADGEVRIIQLADATSAERGWFEPRGVVTAVCVPLWDGTRAHGAIFFDFNATSDAFDPEDTKLLADVGWRCARALAREGKVEEITLDRAVVNTSPSIPPESEKDLQTLLDISVGDVASAERLLEQAVKAIRTGKEKVAVDGTVEKAFERVRAAREELVRLRTLVTRD